jgi:phosphodiesterase/alkaline phosphatase D-like protein
VTGCVIEYGKTTAYGQSTPCSPSPGSGSTGVLVSATVSNLTPSAYYHYRVVATNTNGTATAQDVEFRTLVIPGVDTLPASSVTTSTATLNAKVNPAGQEVTGCVIEYGTTTAYGQSTPCSPSPGSGSTGVLVSAEVVELAANTTYHYRVKATNANGTANAQDLTFKTPPLTP